MCRLLAWVSGTAGTAEAVVGAGALAQFANLTGVHADGWGMAWWGEGLQPSVTHSITPASEDPKFSIGCSAVKSDAALLHLRRATPGMPVAMANCHPFAFGDLAMAHNGSIRPLSRLDQILPPEWEANLRGNTDSERYMLAVIAGREASGRPVADVLGDVVVRLFTEWAPTSLNALCLTSDAVFAVCAYNPGIVPPVGRDPAEEHYALRYRQSDLGVVVASSGIDQPSGDGWVLIDNMTVLEIRRQTVELAFHAVATGSPMPPAEGHVLDGC